MPNKKVNQKSKTADLLIWSPSARKPNLSTRDSILVFTSVVDWRAPCTSIIMYMRVHYPPSDSYTKIAWRVKASLPFSTTQHLRILSDHSGPSSLLFCGSANIRTRGLRSWRGSVTSGEVKKLFSTKLREIVSLVSQYTRKRYVSFCRDFHFSRFWTFWFGSQRIPIDPIYH